MSGRRGYSSGSYGGSGYGSGSYGGSGYGSGSSSSASYSLDQEEQAYNNRSGPSSGRTPAQLARDQEISSLLRQARQGEEELMGYSGSSQSGSSSRSRGPDYEPGSRGPEYYEASRAERARTRERRAEDDRTRPERMARNASTSRERSSRRSGRSSSRSSTVQSSEGSRAPYEAERAEDRSRIRRYGRFVEPSPYKSDGILCPKCPGRLADFPPSRCTRCGHYVGPPPGPSF